MSPRELRAFLDTLECTGQLVRVAVPVDPCLELAAIVNQTVKMQAGGPGLLFERVSRAGLPVAANLFGTIERISLALGSISLAELTDRFASDLERTREHLPIRALAAVIDALPSPPIVTQPPLWRGDSAEKLTLDSLPAIKAWPGDGGAYLTLAQVYSRDPEASDFNCGMYRVQTHGAMTATIRFRPGSDGARHLAAWHDRGEAMPVAVVLGGPPVLTWAAGTALPAGISEVAFCSYLVGEPMAMSECQTSDLLVPSRAEIVVEGVVKPGAWRRDGPFGNHTGCYDVEAHAPELQVLAVHRRPDAIYPWTLVGPPPQENIAMARAAEMLLLPLLQLTVPSVRQLHMPDEGIFHRVAFVTLDTDDARPLAEISAQLWATDLLKGSKLLVVGAADQDARDPSAVFWRVLNRVDWQRDLLINGELLAVDARRLRGPTVQGDPQVIAKVLSRWAGYGIPGRQ